MNRRDFFKLTTFALAGLLFPRFSTERIDMQIGDILVKLAKGEKLMDNELQTLRLFGNQAELNNQFITSIQDGSGVINAKKINANSAEFTIPPIDAIYYKFDTDQTIATSTNTDILWDSVKLTSSYFELDSSDTARIRLKRFNNQLVFLIVGHIAFDSLPYVSRLINVYFYDKSDVQYGISTAVNFSTDYNHAFCIPFKVDENTGSIKIRVQNSGGTSYNAIYGRLSILRLL